MMKRNDMDNTLIDRFGIEETEDPVPPNSDMKSAINKKLCILFEDELPANLFPPEKSFSELLEDIKNRKIRWEGPSLSGRLGNQYPNMQNIPRPNYYNQTEINLPRQRHIEAYRSFFLDNATGPVIDFISQTSFEIPNE